MSHHDPRHDHHDSCHVPNCDESATFNGYCRTHDNAVASFRDRLACAPNVPTGFDAIRDRWTRGYNLLHS